MEEKSLSGLLFTFYKILLTYFTKYWFTLKWGPSCPLDVGIAEVQRSTN